MGHDDARQTHETDADDRLSHGDRVAPLQSGAPGVPPVATPWVVWLIGPLFVALGAWFVGASPLPEIPLGTPASVPPGSLDPVPFARPGSDLPEVVVGGYDHRCNECHRFFNSPPVERRTLTQHTEIVLDHGLNNRCFNCHDVRNRELLVLYDGTRLPFDQVPHLCAQCHGTVYRDWQRGTHGKTLGSWDAASGRQRRLGCNDCHNPHAPAYPAMKPLPAPDTLRMGNQSIAHEHGGRHEPLRRWSSDGAAVEPPHANGTTSGSDHSAPPGGKEHP